MIYQRKQGPKASTVLMVIGMIVVAALVGLAIGTGVMPTHR